MISYRAATWLLALSVISGLIGFTDLAAYSASISRGLCVVFTVILVAGIWHRLNKTKKLREPDPSWSETPAEAAPGK